MNLNNLFNNKTILVTGGIGSIGSEIVKKLREYDVNKIIVIDNRETELFYAKMNNTDSRIIFEFADIKYNLNSLFKNVDIVFHAAAMKHVVISEDSPWQTIETNVHGTKNVIDACITNNVSKMILISTDKAVNPTNVMGSTKLLAEKLIGAIVNSKKTENTKFGIIRFGNVLHSRGSVLEIWGNQLLKNQNLTLTDGSMTRFFMNTTQCIDLIFKAAFYAKFGETFILKMPSVKLENLAKSFLKLKKTNGAINYIGIRKGEKKHEELLLEANDGVILENEELFVKFPFFIDSIFVDDMIKKGFSKSNIHNFSSNDKKFLLSIEEIEKTLKKEFSK